MFKGNIRTARRKPLTLFWCLYRYISSISIADIEQISGSLVGGFATSDLMSSFLASSVVSVTLWEAFFYPFYTWVIG